jgi:carbamoyl-phosphate synthase large subunit
MPRRDDLNRILVLGSGPIVIGQACEFDYSGTQAIKALKDEGYEVILVNSNPATIMTDPNLCDRTYVEPLTPEYLEVIIAREKPDAVLPTVGGQTALNLALDLHKLGILEKYNVELLGASPEAIEVAEDRELFRLAMLDIGLNVPESMIIGDMQGAYKFMEGREYPCVLRPSFTLGGTGGGIAYNQDELETIVRRGLDLSPVSQILIEESLLGWKEYELEVIRDTADNVVIICSIENIDAMGVHTGDSITVAPAQTLTDKEYQQMRNAAADILRKVKVDTGGSNVQFAVDPKTGRLIIIEMNPRVSRSSALASKATGFPIAKIAAKLAVGYTLDELPNDITLKTPAAFEPALDYVVTKIPKFAFEKFSGAETTLGTQMKSVGEVMAIGRTLKESFFKALRSLEVSKPYRPNETDRARLAEKLSRPSENRIRYVVYALEQGWSIEDVHRHCSIDPWFLDQFQQFAELQEGMRGKDLEDVSTDTIHLAKMWGFSDRRIAHMTGAASLDVRARRKRDGIVPVYKRVDTCAAEFESHTPYMYSTYEEECESEPTDARKIMILGSGPNRIGQGIEFDYCSCHASFALKEMGIESIMVNCNPETVSTDYDTSDRLYFEPLTFEDVMNIVEKEKPEGIIVQFGGQTPLNLTKPLSNAGVKIMGTSPDSVDLAEDRERFNEFLDGLEIRYPKHAFASTLDEAHDVAGKLGYPVLVRPSYVLGGRAMAIVYDAQELSKFATEAFAASSQNSVLIDKFLEDAFEVDVDCLCDGENAIVAAIMQHVEQAGVHSGDSSCVLPTYKIDEAHKAEIRDWTKKMAVGLKVQGLMNIQFAIAGGLLYVLEANPRASRTIPYVAKATGVPLAKMATRLMVGETLDSLGLTDDLEVKYHFVKTPVFPYSKFPGVDPRLSPEMRSTGEVMGVSKRLGAAFYKAQLAAGNRLPTEGKVLITVNSDDHLGVLPTAKKLSDLGFKLLATRGTAKTLSENGVDVDTVLKHHEGRPSCVDLIKNDEIALVINTPLGAPAVKDGREIRMASVEHGVPFLTTLSGAAAAAEAITDLKQGNIVEVACLQEIHAE